MTRAVLVAVLVGLVALAGWLAMGFAQADIMPSYLAAWLFWMGVPLGALPLVMAMEGAGVVDWPLLLVLRRLLWLLPIGAIFAIPVLWRNRPLFHRIDVVSPLPEAWMAPGVFVMRTIVILVVLSLFAALFSVVPRRPRLGLAILGLLLHVCLVSVAAVDWVMSLQPGIGSSAFGVLLMLSQAGIAACVASFALAFGTRDARLQKAPGMLLVVLLGSWAFVHFVQYLVVWSANLPAEVPWYLARTQPFGVATVWFAVVASLAALSLLPSALGRMPAVVASIAATLLLVHLAETLWLVTPAFRGGFSVSLADLFAVLGLGGLMVAALLATAREISREAT